MKQRVAHKAGAVVREHGPGRQGSFGWSWCAGGLHEERGSGRVASNVGFAGRHAPDERRESARACAGGTLPRNCS